MWEGLAVNVSCLSAIILTIVGLAKMPFKKFKLKHPKWYRATFFLLSLILVACGGIVAQLYIIGGSLISVQFALFVMGTGVVVFGGYSGYECTNAKGAVKKLIKILKDWLSKHEDSKIRKIVEKYGLDKINAIGSTVEVVPTENNAETNVAAEQQTNTELN